MSNSRDRSVRRPIAVALGGLLLALAVAVIATATANAADYKMLLCAGNNGSNSFQTATNTTSPQNPGGIFSFENHCGPAPDPAGNSAFLRIVENQSGGTAGVNAYGSISWTVPPWVAIEAAGGFTRMPGNFNDGWRGRFWGEDFGGGGHHILLQGTGSPNSGFQWVPTPVFSSHPWPFSGYGDYRRFVFELTCMRQAGCDRGGWNAVDANTISLVLADREDSRARFTDGSALMKGGWVRGSHSVTWETSDRGSGIRWERLRVDGSLRHTIDHGGSCDDASSSASGLFARQFQPCPTGGPWGRSHGLDTAGLSDGQHTLRVCAQDFAQADGFGSDSESCDQRTVRTDNSAPGKPADLKVTSANPARYLPRFGAAFSLPPDQGSPIRKVHYELRNAENKVVVAEKTVSATNPPSLAGIEGPAQPAPYTLRVRLEDEVGLIGPAAEAPVPRDTTPPAAPQELRVAAESLARRVDGFGLRWRNVVDAGAPIDTARFQVLDGAGAVLDSGTARGANIEALRELRTPLTGDALEVRVRLVDAEGNVGAAASVALPRDTTPPAAPQEVSVAPPSTSRENESFDVRWRNIADEGSPVAAAHYEVLNRAGGVVAARTVEGRGISAIRELETPRERGTHALRIWVSDAEGNVGAPSTVPLAYRCVRSQIGGQALSAVLPGGRARRVVRQGRGMALRGRLTGHRRAGVAGSPLCVFSRTLTDAEPEFLGLALSGDDGRYSFPVPAGPSRELTVAHRTGHREIASSVRLLTRVRPSFRVRRRVVRNKRFARFRACVPGPRKAGVLLTLQVKRGEGWLAFRRYRTRRNGCARIVYRFTRTDRPTLYLMRAEVRKQGGFPYETGISRPLRLVVVPARAGG